MFAASKSSSAGADSQVTAFNGGQSVHVAHTDWPSSGYSTQYDITIDANTTFSNGKTIGLGDIVVIGIVRTNGSLYGISTSDFTNLYTENNPSNFPYYIYYAIYTGSDLTISITKFSVATQQPFVYHYFSVRYPDTSSPIDVSIDVDSFSYINSTGSSQTLTIDHPSLTTVTDNAIIINGLLGGTDSSSINVPSYISTPSNMSEACPEIQGLVWGGSGTTYNSFTAVAQTQKTTAGSFDPGTWGDVTVPAGNYVILRSYTLAIKPA